MLWMPIIVLGFLLSFQAQVQGDDYGRWSGEPPGLAQNYTLYYLFSPGEAAHRLHAEELEVLSRSLRRRLQVVRIPRAEQGSDADAGLLPGFRRHHNYPYKLLSGLESTAEKSLPAKLMNQLIGESDYALLFDGKGELVASGAGDEFSRILSIVSLKADRTEVDESTWGKIKELFR